MTNIIPFSPIPASRPRVSKHATYYPKTYLEYKGNIKEYLSLTYKKKPLTEAVRVTFMFHMPIPKSLSKKKKAELVGQYHIKTPDNDNLQKAVLDAMNGIVFHDDSQVAEIFATKKYSDKPCTWYKIEPIKAETTNTIHPNQKELF